MTGIPKHRHHNRPDIPIMTCHKYSHFCSWLALFCLRAKGWSFARIAHPHPQNYLATVKRFCILRGSVGLHASESEHRGKELWRKPRLISLSFEVLRKIVNFFLP